jgi:hypothetical protein
MITNFTGELYGYVWIMQLAQFDMFKEEIPKLRAAIALNII